MTVRQWKRIITATVVLLIIGLVVALVATRTKYKDFFDEYGEIITFLEETQEAGEISSDDIVKIGKELKAREGQLHPEYQTKYKNLYVDNDFVYDETAEEGNNKKVYLTFDDGPSTENTEKILAILKKYDIKATFFVIYRNSDEEKELYRRIVEEGHTIGVHSASHNYEKIYESVEAYLKDFNKLSKHIEELTGVKPEIFRFPGGSVNSYNGAVYEQIISEMTRRGYTYYDWDVSSGDASYGTASASWIAKNVVNGVRKSKTNIVLMHDTNAKDTTVQALTQIIEKLKKKGYTFEKLTKDVKPVTFGYLQ